MKIFQRRSFWLLLSMMIVLASLSGVLAAQGGVTVATGFNGPQGVWVGADGSIWVADSGLAVGDTMPIQGGSPVGLGSNARIIKIAPNGTQTVEAMLPTIAWPSPQDNTGAARITMLNGVVYATSSMWNDSYDSARRANMAAVVKVAGGSATEVANTWAIEAAQNPDGGEKDSHPYGIIGGSDGMLYVADAGGNSLLKVNPTSGAVSVVAVFPPVPNNAGFGPPMSEAVPTGVVQNSDGSFMVSYLPGFPFGAGSAKVVRVTAGGVVNDYATGYAMLTDLQRGPDGQLYGIQFAVWGAQGPAPSTGSLVRIKAGAGPEVVVGGLMFPTAVAFTRTGDAYVTVNGVGAPGSGAVMKYAAVAEPPPPAEIPEPATLALLGAGLAGLAGYVRRRRAG